MTNYAQFTNPLKQLQMQLRNFSSQSNDSYVRQFIQALDDLADFLGNAFQTPNPFEYPNSLAGFAKIIFVVRSLSNYLMIDIEYVSVYPKKLNGVCIKNNVRIVDDIMYQAIVAFQKVIASFIPDLTEDFYNEIGSSGKEIITNFNTMLSLELLRKQVELNKEKFKITYENISEKIESCSEDVSVDEVSKLMQQLKSFINEQDDYLNAFNIAYEPLIARYADLANDLENKTISQFYFDTKALSQKIASFNLLEFESESEQLESELEQANKVGDDDRGNLIRTEPIQMILNLSSSPTTTQETEQSGSDNTFDSLSSDSSTAEDSSVQSIPSPISQQTHLETGINLADAAIEAIEKNISRLETLHQETLPRISACEQQIQEISRCSNLQMSSLESEQICLETEQKQLSELTRYLDELIKQINQSKYIFNIDKEKLSQIKIKLQDISPDLYEQCNKEIGPPLISAKLIQSVSISISVPEDRLKIQKIIQAIKSKFELRSCELPSNLEKHKENINKLSLSFEKENNILQKLTTENNSIINEIEEQKKALDRAVEARNNLIGRNANAHNNFFQLINKEVKEVHQEKKYYNKLTDFYNKLEGFSNKLEDCEKSVDLWGYENELHRFYEQNEELLREQLIGSDRIKTKIADIHQLKSNLDERFKNALCDEVSSRFNELESQTVDRDIFALYFLKSSRTTFFTTDYRTANAVSLELYLINKIFFGPSGFFTQHSNAIKGCASSLLSMFYTCLAYATFNSFNYQTELMFLDDLEKTTNIDDKQAKIAKRLNDYPGTKLSLLLEKYQRRLNDMQEDVVTSGIKLN